MPIYSVGDVLQSIGQKLNGAGVDVSCEPGYSQALAQYNKINRLIFLEPETQVTTFVQIPVSSRYITLDRRFQKIIQAKAGRYDNIKVVGQNFQFIDGISWEQCEGNYCTDKLVLLGANFPTHYDLTHPQLLIAVSDRPEDAGVELLTIGTDEGGNELRTLGVGKGMKTPIIHATCEVSPQFNCGDAFHRGQVANISMLRKPRTQGYVQVWGMDEYEGTVQWLTTMAPDDTSPSLTRYRVDNPSVENVFAEMLVQYVPLYDPNEVSLIQQPDAYEWMTQALHSQDSNDFNAYQMNRNAALSLVKKMRKKDQDGTHHKLNIKVSGTPLRGKTFSFR